MHAARPVSDWECSFASAAASGFSCWGHAWCHSCSLSPQEVAWGNTARAAACGLAAGAAVVLAWPHLQRGVRAVLDGLKLCADLRSAALCSQSQCDAEDMPDACPVW